MNIVDHTVKIKESDLINYVKEKMRFLEKYKNNNLSLVDSQFNEEVEAAREEVFELTKSLPKSKNNALSKSVVNPQPVKGIIP